MNSGKVERPDKREYGIAHLDLLAQTPLLEGISSKSQVWMSHGDSVSVPMNGGVCTASTENCEFTVVESEERGLYGVQFHPEVVHTVEGFRLIQNFVVNICKAEQAWSMESFIDTKVEEIRDIVGDKTVLCGLSGGVDSSVVAALLHKAIGDQLICVFVNNGLLRKGEADLVLSVFKDTFHIRLQYADVEEQFLSALKGVSDPETKRKIVGRIFIDVFEEEARKASDATFLAQGTLYPDVIESISPSGGPSATIKSHHNVGGLPEDLKFTLLEPLRELFKDEVRELAGNLVCPTKLSIAIRSRAPDSVSAVLARSRRNVSKLCVMWMRSLLMRSERQVCTVRSGRLLPVSFP